MQLKSMTKQGFTLIETIITLSIMASVTAASYPYVIKNLQTNAANKIAGEINKINEGAQNYYARTNKWPDQGVTNCQNAISVLLGSGDIPATIPTSGLISGGRTVVTKCDPPNYRFVIGVISSSNSNYQETVNDMVKSTTPSWTNDNPDTAGTESDHGTFYTTTLKPHEAARDDDLLSNHIGDLVSPNADTVRARLNIVEPQATEAKSTAESAQTDATLALTSKAETNGSSTENFVVQELTVATIDNRVNILGGSPFVTLKENDVVNNPQWWWGADGGTFSLRLNNTGTYPIHVKTNATNDAVSEIELGYPLAVTGKGVFSNPSQNSKVVIGTDNKNLLQFSDSDWTNSPDNHILKKSWNSSLGDWLMLKAPGNSADNQSAILLSDSQGVYFGRGTNTGDANDDANTPLNNNNYAKIGSTSWFNGKVRVGAVASPNYTLDVSGDIGLESGTAIGDTRKIELGRPSDLNSGGVTLQSYRTSNSGANHDFIINTVNSGVSGERMRITSSGNVGIAKGNPQHALDVNGTINMYQDADITANPNTKGLRLRESSGDWLLSLGVSNVTNTGFAIRDVAAGTYPLVIRETSGNVGINTTAPTEKLEVNGNIKAKKIFIDDGSGGSTEVGGPGDDGKGWTGGTYAIATGKVTFASDDSLGFTTDDLRGADADVDTFVQKSGDTMTGSLGVSGGQIKMLIDGNGHASLELQPDASTKGSYIDITAGDGTDYGLRLGKWSKAGAAYISTRTSAMKFRTVNTDAITIDTDQNTTFHGNMTVSSDERLKSNIKPLEDSLSKLMNIRGVSYVKKASNQPEIGVIAQEVERQYPELIRNRDDGMKTVNYNGLIGVLIESVKQLSSEIDILKAETHRLRQEVKVLNQRR